MSLQDALTGFRRFPQMNDEESKTCFRGTSEGAGPERPDVMRRRRTFIRRLRHDEHPKDAFPQ